MALESNISFQRTRCLPQPSSVDTVCANRRAALLLFVGFCGALVTKISMASTCDVDAAAFQSEVLNVLREDYPGKDVRAGSSYDVVVMGEKQFGLQNLRAVLCERNPPPSKAEVTQAIRTFVQAVLSTSSAREKEAPLAWLDAKKHLMLQLMPAGFTQLNHSSLVSRPFIPGVSIGVVLDDKEGYRYVGEDDQTRWSVDVNTVFAEAMSNLKENSESVQLQGGGGPEKFVAIAKEDGYDAVRLLVPAVQAAAGRLLGTPFFAAIPNRDFVIMWSTNDSAGFQAHVRAQVAADNGSRPYPLSPSVLKVSDGGKIEVVP